MLIQCFVVIISPDLFAILWALKKEKAGPKPCPKILIQPITHAWFFDTQYDAWLAMLYARGLSSRDLDRYFRRRD